MCRHLKLLTGIVLMSVTVPVFSQQRDPYIHGHMWDSGGWFLGPIFMLLLLAVIIAFVFFLFKQTSGSIHGVHKTPTHSQDTPLEVLKIRYAKGELDHEEFELRRKTLES